MFLFFIGPTPPTNPPSPTFLRFRDVGVRRPNVQRVAGDGQAEQVGHEKVGGLVPAHALAVVGEDAGEFVGRPREELGGGGALKRWERWGRGLRRSSARHATLPSPLLTTASTTIGMPPTKYAPNPPQSPGSWPTRTAAADEPSTVVARNAASLRTDGTATFSGSLMPTWRNSPSMMLRRVREPSARAEPNLGIAFSALSAASAALTSSP